jgi:hypothetical protein
MVRLSSFNEENDKIIVIKKKYELDYPDLKNIFNLWEVLDYFSCNNVKLSKQDKLYVYKLYWFRVKISYNKTFYLWCNNIVC